MRTNELSAATLVSILIAGSFLSDFAPQAGSFLPTLGGIVLLVILFSYDREGVRSAWQSLGFGGVAGFCAALAIAPIPELLNASSDSGNNTVRVATTHVTLRALSWLVATIVFSLIDRARMGRRTLPAPGQTSLSYGPNQSFASIRPSSFEPSSSASPAPHTPAAAGVASPSQATPFVYTQGTHESLLATEPASAVPISDPPIAEEDAQPASSGTTQVPVAPADPPPRQAIELPPTGAGKATTICLNLLDQGIACLRTVQAEHLGRDFYRIVEPEPEGENWEFHPGQVVRCRKQKLSNGKALVAFEEAPRAL